ncbi:MAG: ATP-binding protein [Candidatus Abyssobacteria bacterium SURF_5]|uniref:ATP-binding protein n=1 Tax=Abyssobacteria bacterium (strain SURF_5) TaxID=2093360 RepID=A0A3A4NJL0_ABYX5|nr:MAG: ATP-binding protein [Candidatus Abyssubacteria bacterium SURF_5]
MNKLPWKPWHKVVKLRDDLKSGKLTLNMFAADLYEVSMQRGKQPVYENPESFFALTYPTYNLRQLVRDVVHRLDAKNDKAVRQLELTYGGGKTHTLITLRHLVHDPDSLPNLPAVQEFAQEFGQKPPKCRIASLCFDKLDVEKGMAVLDPSGNKRTLQQPWSVLAYQIAGDAGLKLLHAKGKAEERDTAPAENLLSELIEIPTKENLGMLILIDEVLMYACEKVAQDGVWRTMLINFFQYLTQAATKVDRCCIVASLLATDPAKSDSFGRQLLGDLYDIFRRQREEAVEPVVKEDVAEVLCRRFFTPESVKDRGAFRQHVVAALKGIQAVDEQTRKQGAEAEDRFLKSYPFHPDLTDVFYGKWTTMNRFQRTRGVLRTFALALREAEKWDTNPLIGPAIFLTAPDREGLSEATRELVTVADTEESEGKKQAWTGILDGEFYRARQIQDESGALKNREIEQAVVTTFLHSQPPGNSAKTRDLLVLLSSARPDKIELEKGLSRWAQVSHWLDDSHTGVADGQLPTTWKMGNRPNLTQMHTVAARNISEDDVRAQLLDEISKVKPLKDGASAAGALVHVLPLKPKDIADDGAFHYAILNPSAASDSGKPSAEAVRFLDETTGPDKPRVYRNAVILLVPSREGVDLAMMRVRDKLAWEIVREEIKKQQKDGNIDPARAHTLQIYIDKARGRVPEAIRQAYCIVVTVSEKNDAQAFKITVSEDFHFSIIKNDKRSRIQDTPITAEAILPTGPYNLWRQGETSRRVKDLSGAFAQLPHLPKMLKTAAILETLAAGCEQGTFVLRLTRPDHSFRTWWMSRPDENALNDPALELVLPEAAELADLPPGLLAPGKLPELWKNDEITLKQALDYFNGQNVVQVDRGDYQEPLQIPKAETKIVSDAVAAAVEKGDIWLISGPASLLAETIPAGVLQEKSILCRPPDSVLPAEILPGILPDAWKNDKTTAFSIATSLSMQRGKTLPWKTVKDAISAALQARFIETDEKSGDWPCDFSAAKSAKFKVISDGGSAERPKGGYSPGTNKLFASAELEPSQIQDLGDIIHEILEIKAKNNFEIKFNVQIEIGDGKQKPPPEVAEELNKLLKNVKDDFQLQ